MKKAAAAAAAENITMAEVNWCGIRAGAYGEKGMRRQMEDETLGGKHRVVNCVWWVGEVFLLIGVGKFWICFEKVTFGKIHHHEKPVTILSFWGAIWAYFQGSFSTIICASNFKDSDLSILARSSSSTPRRT